MIAMTVLLESFDISCTVFVIIYRSILPEVAGLNIRDG